MVSTYLLREIYVSSALPCKSAYVHLHLFMAFYSMRQQKVNQNNKPMAEQINKHVIQMNTGTRLLLICKHTRFLNGLQWLQHQIMHITENLLQKT